MRACKSSATERLSVSAEKDALYMLNFLWLLIRPFAWLARWLRKIFRTAFGQLSWRPPFWLQRGFARLVLFRRGHPILRPSLFFWPSSSPEWLGPGLALVSKPAETAHGLGTGGANSGHAAR